MSPAAKASSFVMHQGLIYFYFTLPAARSAENHELRHGRRKPARGRRRAARAAALLR